MTSIHTEGNAPSVRVTRKDSEDACVFASAKKVRGVKVCVGCVRGCVRRCV